MKRIGMLTSGGDCQSLNATMRGVVKGLNVLEGTVEIYGFIDGYKGLIYGNYKRLTSKDFVHSDNRRNHPWYIQTTI